MEALFGPTALGVVGAAAILLVAALASHAASMERSRSRPAPAILPLWVGAAAGVISMLSGSLLSIVVALEIHLAATDRSLASRGSIGAAVIRWLRRLALAAGAAVLAWQSASTRIGEISLRIIDGEPFAVNLGFLLLLGGLVTTLGALPVPLTSHRLREVPPSAAVFAAVAPRIVATVATVRLLELTVGEQWIALSRLAAICLILVGTVGVVAWIDLRRRLACAAVAHIGAVLLALGSYDDQAGTPLLFGLLSHGLTFAGAFTAIALLDRRETRSLRPVTLLGAGRHDPLAGGALSLCLLSVGALPFTPGFLSTALAALRAIEIRDQIAAYALSASFIVLAGTALATIGRLYALPLSIDRATTRRGAAAGFVSIAIAAFVLLVGTIPAPLFRWIDGLLGTFG